jgi:hypothetical protein
MIRRGIPYVFLAGPVLLALDCLFGDSAGKSLASARSLARISQHGRASIFVTAMPAATIVHFPAQDSPKPALTRGRRMTLERILRENTGRYESSTITYAFSNKQSRTCIKSGPDEWKQCCGGMRAVVFHDPKDLADMLRTYTRFTNWMLRTDSVARGGMRTGPHCLKSWLNW